MSSHSSNSGTTRTAAPGCPAGALRVLAPVALALALLAAPAPAGASATLPEMARLEAAERLERIQVDRLARWYVALGLAGEASEFVERRIRAGDLSRPEAASVFEAIVRGASRRGDAGVLRGACDAALRNGDCGPAVLRACAEGLRAEGRLDAAAALLSRIPPGDPDFPHARLAIGQIAVARGDLAGALPIFRDLKSTAASARDGEVLAARAALAEESVLILAAQPADRAAEGPEAGPADAASGPSTWPSAATSSPALARVLEGLREGDAAGGRGEIDAAVRAYRRALDESDAALAGPLPSDAGAAGELRGAPEAFLRLLAAHEAAETAVVANAAGGSRPPSPEVRDLLADVLCLDFLLARANESLPPSGARPAGRFLPAGRRDAIIVMIERNALGGMDAGRLLAGSGEAVELFGNLAHPIGRYRSLVDLEGRQDAIAALVGYAGRSRGAFVASLESPATTDLPALLRDLDAYLRDLDAVRSARDEARDVIRRHFDIFPAGRGGDPDDDAAAAAAREGFACAGDAAIGMRRAARDLEQRARAVARGREERELRGARGMAVRRYAEALVRQAQALEEVRPDGWQPRFWRALEECVAFLPADAFDRAFRTELAARVGTLVAGRFPQWERFPERAAAGPEDGLIRKLLPMLATGPAGEGSDGRVLWISALFRWRIGEPGAAAAGRGLLAKDPAGPMAGHVALRLGHEALRGKRWREAEALYREAAGRGPAEVVAAARFMLGWLAYRQGDADGALRELAVPLSGPVAARPGAGALEDDAVALAIRCGTRLPAGLMTAYGPVRERTPAGKRILAGLAEAESRRGRMGRAAELFAAIAKLYPRDGDDLAYEIRSVESLARGGMDNEALPAALALARRVGPGAAAKTPEGERAAQDAASLARILRDLADRRFAEGMRSGRPEPMAAAAAALAEHVRLAAPGNPAEQAELRLTWAIAALRSGDRPGGLRLLDGIVSGGSSGRVAERAALLHSDAATAGFASRELPAAAVEESLARLLGRFPGEKSAVLGTRAAHAFLQAGDPARAARVAAAAEGCGAAAPGVRSEAGLVHARALLAAGDLPAVRAKADEILRRTPVGPEPDARAHALDILILATRREAAGKAGAGDRAAAGRLLEGLADRFPDLPETPSHLLDALGHYRDGSDGEAAIRTGTSFLKLFPGRSECLEVAATIGPLMEARGRGADAATLYARVSERFPRDGEARRFLFRAARLAEKEGDLRGARRWYAEYARRFPEPRWVNAYAVLSESLLASREDRSARAIEALEKGLRLVDSVAGENAPEELAERAGKARIAVGEYWAARFREIALVDPLEKTLARKQRCFRRSLAAYEAAARSGPAEARLEASRASGDLFVEFGTAIMESQRPGGMDAEERAHYERALAARSRKYVERALADYSGALDRLKRDGLPAGLAEPFLARVETTTRLLAMLPAAGETR